MAEEKILTLNLRKYVSMAPRWRRAPRAIKAVRELVKKNLKVKNVTIGASLNELIWSKGAKNPITKIKVKTIKDGEKVTVDLIETKKREKVTEKRKEEKKEK
ncbi:MAG: 60S ribosomal protein L31 [Candidatus Parvarchaeota archaeon]|nr:60S ribosomal protein L31 [Candidatus Jingweiarchaeum tengchongense]MCW1298225.1 60S ribosomal protein L31 [Candidatus Jingweiarchaeum tengchongense]MCW1300023.1 60S ribosomal protein L31 [Candidatus Jingweiarchaeum tengchongense]MCW1304838.1 60S ribosomal protein L31 [Candidatus Jingweiarchaeum tengchongense]MCW1305428.1 60S ribosomal protein L31 [Candidatus Jingweiarchaeum tengchongense]